MQKSIKIFLLFTQIHQKIKALSEIKQFYISHRNRLHKNYFKNQSASWMEKSLISSENENLKIFSLNILKLINL
jgi:hypothetical protein